MHRTLARLSCTLMLPLALSAAGGAVRAAGAQTEAPSAPADSGGEDLINADRPGIADGSRVVHAGQIQLEVAAQRERHTDGDARRTLSFAPTLLRVGVVPWLELRVESNTITHEHVAGDTTDDPTGLSPVLFGFKLALYDSHAEQGRVSLGTIVRVAPRSGSDGFGTAHPTGDLRLAADWDLAPRLSLNPNAGVARYEGASGELFTTALGALTLTYQPSSRWSPFVDAGYQSREDAGASWSLIVDAGAGYIVGRDVQLDVSAGTGVHGDSVPRSFIAVGLSVRGAPFHRRPTHQS